jgi:hypothetical protein
MNPVNGDHLGALFWGDRPQDPSKPKIDNAGWIQFMAPFGGMWDYHPPKHHNLPHETLAKSSQDSTHWCTTEILCNLEKGTVRAAVDGWRSCATAIQHRAALQLLRHTCLSLIILVGSGCFWLLSLNPSNTANQLLATDANRGRVLSVMLLA